MKIPPNQNQEKIKEEEEEEEGEENYIKPSNRRLKLTWHNNRITKLECVGNTLYNSIVHLEWKSLGW